MQDKESPAISVNKRPLTPPKTPPKKQKIDENAVISSFKLIE